MRNSQPVILYMCKEMAPTRREQLDMARLGFQPRMRNSQHVDSVEKCDGVVFASDEVRARVISKAPAYRNAPDGRKVWAQFLKRQEEAFNDLGDEDLEEDEDEDAPEPVDYSKQTKPQLLALAEKRGLAHEGLTKNQLAKALEEQDEDGGQGAGTGGDEGDVDFNNLD